MAVFKSIIVMLFVSYHSSSRAYLQRQSQFSVSQKPYVRENEGILEKLRFININNMHHDKAASVWPLGVIAYYFDNKTYDSVIADNVRTSMDVLEESACIRFELQSEQPANKTWIHITNPKRERECQHSPTFRESGEIVLVLGYDCLKPNEILHALLHAVGFNDEVTHPQRDQFVKIIWSNIRPEYRHLYHVVRSGAKPLSEYDPLSIMHFHDRAFSINGQATVLPLMSGLMIKPSDELSQLDKMKLRLLFDHECNKRNVESFVDTCVKTFQLEKGLFDNSAQVHSDVDKEELNKGSTSDSESERESNEKVPDSENKHKNNVSIPGENEQENDENLSYDEEEHENDEKVLDSETEEEDNGKVADGEKEKGNNKEGPDTDIKPENNEKISDAENVPENKL
ncbi:zinc metalloproteinase nas-14-like [Leptidea sinapis]|uniref:zinc metalloproteinase nas-14-like n=1 Tax=Leptidea sinapis TaxID=189913 RepID=UPI00213F4B86|nr:zinc metalloproteinase nas-14-like [Leptidea sinapis]